MQYRRATPMNTASCTGSTSVAMKVDSMITRGSQPECRTSLMRVGLIALIPAMISKAAGAASR